MADQAPSSDTLRPGPDKQAAPPPSPPEEPVRATLARLSIPLLAVITVLGVVAIVVFDWSRWTADADHQTTDDASVGADLSTISAQVNGIIRRVGVSDYQRVEKDQLIAEIDPREYDAAVDLATANLDAASGTLANLSNQIDLQRAAIDVATAQHAAALAQQSEADDHLRRQTDLGDATSRQQRDDARAAKLVADAAVQSAMASIEQQQAELNVLLGQRTILTAQVSAARANLETARIHQGYTRIQAPFDGTIGKLQVHEGDLVAAGTGIVPQVPLPKVYLIANFKETQLARMTPGRGAEIRIDTFPGETLRGKVDQLAPASGSIFALLPPDNATGNYTKVVQRIPVRITLLPDQPLTERLRPGMSATVTVDTSVEPAR